MSRGPLHLREGEAGGNGRNALRAFISQLVLPIEAAIFEWTTAAAIAIARGPWGCYPISSKNIPERRLEIAISCQEVLEELTSEKLERTLEERTMTPGELEPPVPLARKHARNLQDQSRVFSHLPVRMGAERFQTGKILAREVRLVEKSVQLVQSFHAIALSSRDPLTVLAGVNAMAATTEALIRARPAADSAIMSHAQSMCESAIDKSTVTFRCGRGMSG
jgi:hypothetical protein